MKKIQLKLSLEHLNFLRNNGYNSAYTFSIVHDPVLKNKISASEWFDTCRETVCDRIRTSFVSHNDFDVKKLKLLVNTKMIACHEADKLIQAQKDLIKERRISYKDDILIGLRIINIIERKLKWPLTRVYPIKCDQLTKNHKIYCFVGNKKWIKSPNIFSLFMLLVRSGISIKKGRTFESTDGFYRSLFENETTTDISYLKAHFKRSLIALKHYNKLFGETSMRDLYTPNTHLNLFPEGINSLCDLNTNDVELHGRFVKILNEEKELESWEADEYLKKRSNT